MSNHDAVDARTLVSHAWAAFEQLNAQPYRRQCAHLQRDGRPPVTAAVCALDCCRKQAQV